MASMTDKGSSNSLPSSTQAQAVLETFLGPLVIGIMIEQFLLGIVCSKAIAYFRYHFSSDGIFCRSIVTCLVVSTAFIGILDFAILYRTLIYDYGDSEKFELQSWMTWTEPGLAAWIAFVAHIFYIFRCWVVTRSLVICIFLGVVALNALASGITLTVFCFLSGRLSNHLESVVTTSTVFWFLLAITCDLGIAIVLVLYLWRKESVLRSNSAMVSRLQRSSIETGSLTAICVLSNLILLLYTPDKGYDFFVHYPLPHIYILSVLYTLLGREDLRNILHEGHGTFASGFQSSFLAAGVLSTTSLENRFNGEALRQRGQSSNVYCVQ